ncbi:hypothetical protein Niako_1398 [Niastella koreensis GR20-10]|uniref:Uncharacterized protein n=1 Tax=Niastella koreensis (strain DSM 17620 / KACC 11465 / NBRC 106392 / GR20-10) TaxID=700598 RepID=G8TPE8_NIAKG|nr:hypothetical protein Niako_1398 [Niastella koreensis GR20-10]
MFLNGERSICYSVGREIKIMSWMLIAWDTDAKKTTKIGNSRFPYNNNYCTNFHPYANSSGTL